MYHLLNESPMLELALSLLEEGVKQLDTYAPFPGMCPKVCVTSELVKFGFCSVRVSSTTVVFPVNHYEWKQTELLRLVHCYYLIAGSSADNSDVSFAFTSLTCLTLNLNPVLCLAWSRSLPHSALLTVLIALLWCCTVCYMLLSTGFQLHLPSENSMSVYRCCQMVTGHTLSIQRAIV